MSKLFITFETASAPVDTDDEQEAVKPVFEKIVSVLRTKEVRIIDAPAEWDAYGWYVEVAIGSATLTCMMQRSNSWLLLITSNRSIIDRLKGRHHEAELRALANLIVDIVQDTFQVPARLFQTEAAFRAA